MNRYSNLPPFPERIARLEDLAVDLWWSWHAETREVFRRLDYALWRATAHNPVRMLRLRVARAARTGRRRPGVPASSTTARSPALDDARGARNTWWSRSFPQLSRADRLLLRRVRAAPVAADLRRRPRRARRRSLQGSERPRRAAHRRRVHVSAGLLPPAHLGGRLAGGELRAAELGRRADRAGARRPTASRASPPCRSAIARCSWPCGACASAA